MSLLGGLEAPVGVSYSPDYHSLDPHCFPWNQKRLRGDFWMDLILNL